MAIDCLSLGILVADHLCSPIERLPLAGELVLADELPLNIGGCAANVAMNLARLGVSAGVVGRVGSDVFGRFVIDTLRAAGLDTSAVQPIADVGTSGTLIVNVAGQDRRFIHAIGANAKLTADDFPLARLHEARILYVGGYGILPALEPQALARLFAAARRAGVTTVLDVVLPPSGDHWNSLVPVLPHTDVFLPNEDEAVLITGLKDPRAAALRLREAGAGTVVITRGGNGVVLAANGVRLESPGYSMPYVGGTGAGDAFDAGYIVGLLAGEDEAGCLAWGSALGASCVRAISATESVFTRKEAEAFLREHPLEVTKW